jgi:hypothetical protein
MLALTPAQLWADARHLLRREAPLLLPVAGLFLFLPQLMLARVMAGVPQPAAGMEPAELLAMFIAAASMVLALIGQTVLLQLLLGGPGGRSVTVGGALQSAAPLVVAALAATMMQGLAIVGGFLLLVLPGIYLMARLSLVLPALVAERSQPTEAVVHSWKLTEGHALVLAAGLLAPIAGFVALALGLGAAERLLLGDGGGPVWSVGRWALETVGAAASALLSVYYLGLTAVAYHLLSRNGGSRR